MLKFIAALIVVFGIGAIAFYFVTDRFPTKIGSEWKNAAEWTPERVAADPAGFLASSLVELDGFDKQLQSQQIALRAQQSEVTRERELTKATLVEITAKSDLLKAAYKSAQRTGAWPVSATGLQCALTETQARGLILDADWNRRRLAKRMALYEQALSVNSKDLAEAEKMVAQIRDQRVLISGKEEELRLKQAVSIEGIRSEVAAIGNRTGTLATRRREVSTGEQRLFAREAARSTEDDTAFQRILGDN